VGLRKILLRNVPFASSKEFARVLTLEADPDSLLKKFAIADHKARPPRCTDGSTIRSACRASVRASDCMRIAVNFGKFSMNKRMSHVLCLCVQ
jgi:hypothetical protein